MYWPADREAEFVALWETTNLSASQIAHRLHVSRSAVLGKAHRMNLSTRSHMISSRYGDGDARRDKLPPKHSHLPPRVIVAEAPPASTIQFYRPPPQMTKNQLRSFLSQAVRNTAAIETAEAS